MTHFVFDRLSRHADQWVREWNETSKFRRRHNHSWTNRYLLRAGERPIRFHLEVAGTVTAIGVLSWVLLLNLVTPLGKDILLASNLLSYFGGLWAIQATMAALIYPITISFVAILLQRRASAKLSLRIYALHAAVLPAGGSAIALVAWMGLQYLAMPFMSADWILAAMISNAIWFLANILLTSHFIYITILFLNDDTRLAIFQRHAVQVALPRDLRRHLLGIIFQNAQARGLLPGRSYTSEGVGPKVLLYPMAIGSSCVSMKLHHPREVLDVRLRTLRLALRIWLRQAAKEKPKPAVYGLNQKYPTLQIAFHPEQVIEGDVTLARSTGQHKPGAITRFLIQRSLVLGTPQPPEVSFSTTDMLEEVAAETIELIEQHRYEAASTAIMKLVEIHSTLINAGSFINDDGIEDNATLLPEPYAFASERLHSVWVRTYNELAELAVRTLPRGTRPFERHAYLLRYLISQVGEAHPDILARLLQIPVFLMYRLEAWWSLQAEERGILQHNQNHGVELPAPIGRVYEVAIETFIGAWEGTSLRHATEKAKETTDRWTSATRSTTFAITQLDHTLDMLLHAVSVGDLTAASWFADSILKWWDTRRHEFGDAHIYDAEDPFATAALLSKDWKYVQTALSPVPNIEESSAIEGVVASILKNYWHDTQLLGVLALLRQVTSDLVADSLSMRMAIALMEGKPLKSGGSTDAVPLSRRSVVRQFFRMHLTDDEYTRMFDRRVEKLTENSGRRMVAGRVYGSHGGHSLDSFIPIHALLLTSTMNTRANFPHIDALEARWSKDLQRSERAERAIRRLAEAFGSGAYHSKRLIAAKLREVVSASGTLELAEGRLKYAAIRLADRIVARRTEIIAAAPLSQARLDETAQAVSQHILSETNEVFPFLLRPRILASEDTNAPEFLTFSSVRKAPYTEPPLEAASDSLASFYSEHISTRIAREILRTHLQANGIEPLRVDTHEHFLEDIQTAAVGVQERGLTPLLLLPRHNRPDVANVWRYFRQDPAQTHPLRVRRASPTDPKGVAGYFHDVPAYVAPLSRFCCVVAKEDFASLRYAPHAGGACVGVSAQTQGADTLDLSFAWSFVSSRLG